MGRYDAMDLVFRKKCADGELDDLRTLQDFGCRSVVARESQQAAKRDGHGVSRLT